MTTPIRPANSPADTETRSTLEADTPETAGAPLGKVKPVGKKISTFPPDGIACGGMKPMYTVDDALVVAGSIRAFSPDRLVVVVGVTSPVVPVVPTWAAALSLSRYVATPNETIARQSPAASHPTTRENVARDRVVGRRGCI
jgi:hypothetical protein